jgi:hypothetical protein
MPRSTNETPLGVNTNTRYLKRVLIPFWVIRCILMILMLVADIAALVIVKSYDSDGKVKGAAIG